MKELFYVLLFVLIAGICFKAGHYSANNKVYDLQLELNQVKTEKAELKLEMLSMYSDEYLDDVYNHQVKLLSETGCLSPSDYRMILLEGFKYADNL